MVLWIYTPILNSKPYAKGEDYTFKSPIHKRLCGIQMVIREKRKEKKTGQICPKTILIEYISY